MRPTIPSATTATTRTSRSRRTTALLLAATLATSVLATAASAEEEDEDDLPPVPECDLADFPEDALLGLCIELHMQRGEAKLGNVETTLDDPVVVRQMVAAGIDEDGELATEIVEDEDAAPLAFPAIEVPGGLFGGIPLLEDLPLGPLGDVTATIEPLAELTTGEIDLEAFLLGEGTMTVANLPFRLRLDNLLLGDACYIGSPADPIDLNLAINLSGGFFGGPAMNFVDMEVIDDTFAVPGASGCGLLAGPLLDELGLADANLVNGLIDDQVGLPSGSGDNLLRFEGLLAGNGAM